MPASPSDFCNDCKMEIFQFCEPFSHLCQHSSFLSFKSPLFLFHLLTEWTQTFLNYSVNYNPLLYLMYFDDLIALDLVNWSPLRAVSLVLLTFSPRTTSPPLKSTPLLLGSRFSKFIVYLTYSSPGITHISRSLDCFHFSSVAPSCPTLCDPMNRSMPGLPVHHQLQEFTQTHVHWVSDAIQPSHPLSSPSPPAFNLSQHQSLFKWVNSSHQVAKVLEFQHQSFQWIFRTDFL